MSRRSNRRQFLQQSAAVGIGFWTAGGVSLAAADASKPRSPLERLRIAGVGVNGKGSSDIDQAGNFGDVIALCDIDDNSLNEKANKFTAAKKFNDFREMLTKMGDSIDAVVVSTPDHTHAPAAVMAMKLKKHVYCQKPLTHTVYEARVMRETAAKYQVATQMGNQGTAENGLREAVEIIRSGGIGPVREVHVWTNRPIWPQAPQVTTRPAPEPETPKHIHWDLFLGPAPERPYAKGYHPFAWRGWWDFGTGALGDMACHTMNMAFMALRLAYPTSVVAESGPLNPETYPGWAKIVWEFPARGTQPPVKLFWYEGRRDDKKVLPPEELTRGQQVTDSGSLLVGDKGILYSPNDYGASFKLLPEKEFNDYKRPERVLPRNGKGDEGQKAEWIAAINGGQPALSNFDYAGLLTETVLLGNVAIRARGKKLEWDGPGFKILNDASAQQFLHTEYRSGWTL
jgi:predicted dehydrogenase